jgi:sensor histidine kinase YesM
MSEEKAIYWLTQVCGWFGYILLILFQNLLAGQVDVGIVKVLITNFVLGIVLSHSMRAIILRYHILAMPLILALPRIALLSIGFGALASLIYAEISDLFFTGVPRILKPSYGLLLELFFPFSTVYLFWNILYFAAIYLKNYEREEVKNLRLSAAMQEIELRNLRSQLNPHFMFNALNSIRALIDENPALAKLSLTRMSSILRNSLMAEKRRFVTLEEEMKVVTDYLELEKIRYEERLRFELHADEAAKKAQIPPLLLQTCVENAIKHGISKLVDGGMVTVHAQLLQSQRVGIEVFNSGNFEPGTKAGTESTGIGLENSKRRLSLLYGDNAALTIGPHEGGVLCTIELPLGVPE